MYNIKYEIPDITLDNSKNINIVRSNLKQNIDHYKEEIEKYFGEGSCHILKVRKYGGKKVEL
mgnify:FL=1